MNKILLSAVAGVAVINAANAGIKETCLDNPDKLVWVEKTERCVPINTCKSSDQTIVDSYCNTTFADVQVGNYEQADKLARKYIQVRMNKSVTSGGVIKTTYIGQDYYGYKLSDGGYVVFEFDDTSDRTDLDVKQGVVSALCRIVGGFDLTSSYTIGGNLYICYGTHFAGTPNGERCKAFADMVSDVYGYSVSYNSNYEEEHKSDTSCEIKFL